MRANANIFWILAVFLFLADGIYIFWSLMDAEFLARNHNSIDWVGAVAIGLTGLLSAFIAFYLSRVHKSQGGELPEDRTEAEIDDGDAEQGHFSPWSWWPLILAFSAALVFLGIAVGVWLAIIGGAIFVVAIVGWVYEYYRGFFAR